MGIRGRRVWYLLMAAAAALGIAWLAMANGAGRLYVVNTLSQSLSVIDTTNDTVAGTIPLGSTGYRIAIAPDGATAYVTAADAVQVAQMPVSNVLPNATLNNVAQQANAPAGRLLAVDLARKTIRKQYLLEIAPLADVHLAPNGKRAYVVTAAPPGQRNTVRGRVLILDLPGGHVSRIINVGLNPLDSAVARDGSRLYTADWASRAISAVDLRAGRLLDTIPLGAVQPRLLALSPDARTLYVAQERLGDAVQTQVNAQAYNAMAQAPSREAAETPLCAIDTRTNAVRPIAVDGAVTAMALSPDGARLYLCLRTLERPIVTPNTRQQTITQQAQPPAQQAYTLTVVDTRTLRVEKELGAHGPLLNLALSPDGRKLYLIGTAGDPKQEATVRSRIATQRNTAPRYDAKGINDPNRQSPTQVTTLLNELTRLDKTITILDADSGKTIKTLPVGSFPQGVGVR